jgi:hypothetical protein
LTVSFATAASAVPVAAGLGVVDAVTVVGGADTAAELGATVGVWVSADELELGWALLARLAGPLDAGPQPDSSMMAANTAVSDLMTDFMVAPDGTLQSEGLRQQTVISLPIWAIRNSRGGHEQELLIHAAVSFPEHRV